MCNDGKFVMSILFEADSHFVLYGVFLTKISDFERILIGRNFLVYLYYWQLTGRFWGDALITMEYLSNKNLRRIEKVMIFYQIIMENFGFFQFYKTGAWWAKTPTGPTPNEEFFNSIR